MPVARLFAVRPPPQPPRGGWAQAGRRVLRRCLSTAPSMPDWRRGHPNRRQARSQLRDRSVAVEGLGMVERPNQPPSSRASAPRMPLSTWPPRSSSGAACRDEWECPLEPARRGRDSRDRPGGRQPDLERRRPLTHGVIWAGRSRRARGGSWRRGLGASGLSLSLRSRLGSHFGKRSHGLCGFRSLPCQGLERRLGRGLGAWRRTGPALLRAARLALRGAAPLRAPRFGLSRRLLRLPELRRALRQAQPVTRSPPVAGGRLRSARSAPRLRRAGSRMRRAGARGIRRSQICGWEVAVQADPAPWE